MCKFTLKKRIEQIVPVVNQGNRTKIVYYSGDADALVCGRFGTNRMATLCIGDDAWGTTRLASS